MVVIGDTWMPNVPLTGLAGFDLSRTISNLDITTNSLPSDEHHGGANIVFCDIHVEFAKQQVWLSNDDNILAKWNNDHQPHRELLKYQMWKP